MTCCASPTGLAKGTTTISPVTPAGRVSLAQPADQMIENDNAGELLGMERGMKVGLRPPAGLPESMHDEPPSGSKARRRKLDDVSFVNHDGSYQSYAGGSGGGSSTSPDTTAKDCPGRTSRLILRP